MTISELSVHLARVKELQKHKAFRDSISGQGGIDDDLQILDAMISRMESELVEGNKRVEEYARSIDDIQVRVAFRLHYINGLSWTETAKAMGTGTKQGVRSMVRRYVVSRSRESLNT